MNTFLIALCIFLAVTSAYGATVLLEDGTVLKGEIVSESEAELQVSFGEFEDQVAGLILTEVADADTAVFYKALDMKAKGPFLARFWQARNPLMLKYYYDYHFGRRYVTVSDAYFERGDLIPKKYITRALAAFERYFQFLDPAERGYYQDLSLVASQEVLSKIQGAFGRSLIQLREVFWLEQDPTPTTQVNERRVEHYRRVHFARSNFAEGLEEWHGRGWDRRGDVYIRLGHPDHQSWSDYLVFETDEKVVKVKNRLNMMAANALEEVMPSKHVHGQSSSSYGYGAGPETAELRGVPTFPVPRRRSVMRDGSELGYKWES